jgi:hypothetical protein
VITIPIHTIPSVEPGTDASTSVGVGVISCACGAFGGSATTLPARLEADVTSTNNTTRIATDITRIVGTDLLRTRAVYHGVILANLTIMV